jgi:hypothetical protein
MKSVLRLSLIVATLALCVAVWLSTRGPAPEPTEAAAPHSKAPSSEVAALAERAELPEDPSEHDEPEADARSATPNEAENAAAATPTQTGDLATLRVQLVSKEFGAPLPGKRVAALIADHQGPWSATNSKSSPAAPGEAALTDSEGRAELLVVARRDHTVHILHKMRFDVFGAAPPLDAGATFDLRLEIVTDADRVFHARLVDAATDAPISGARVRIDGAESGVESDAAGRFQLSARSWIDRFARIEAPGYSWRVASISAGHGSPAKALVIELQRSGTLELHVRAAGLPLVDASVTVSTDAYHMHLQRRIGDFYLGGTEPPEWHAKTGVDGVARLEELPSGAPLNVRIDARERSRIEPTPITLTPGETRRVEVAFDRGARIVGRVETTDGRSLAGVEIWRLVAEYPLNSKLLESYEKPVEAARSDSDGGFAFESVPAGAWWIGVAPEQSPSGVPLAPLAMLVDVSPTIGVVEVVVRTDEGLHITGVVLDPDGQPAQSLIFAQRSSLELFAHANASPNGQFSVGPLPAGDYELSAGGVGAKHARSEKVVAAAGASGVELRLKAGAAIVVRVTRDDGGSRDGDIRLSGAGPEGGGVLTGLRNGLSRVEGLAPGRWSVLIQTGDGFVAARTGIDLRAGQTPLELDLALTLGGRLSLSRASSKERVHYELRSGGERIARGALASDAPETLVVPPGDLELRVLSPGGEMLNSRRLTLAPGERLELEIGG